MACECGGTCGGCGTTRVTLDTVQVLELKNFSPKERAKLAKNHEAMPGGGFPIRNGSDLQHAIEAIGRAKDPEAAKAWIKKRAKDLGMTDQLPQTWSLAARIAALELAIIAIGQQSFGDSEGHPFHGNQYSGGGGGKPTERDVRSTKPEGGRIGDAEHIKALGEKFADPKLAASVRKDPAVAHALANPPEGWAAHPTGNNSLIKLLDTPKGNSATGEIMVNTFEGKTTFMPTISMNRRNITPEDSPLQLDSADEAAKYVEDTVASMKRR